MAINFPDSPTTNQISVIDGISYQWNGTYWTALNTSYTGLTASKALVTDANGIITVAGTTSTQIGYLSTTTSDVQTQLNSKLPLTGGTVSGDLTVGGLLSVTAASANEGGQINLAVPTSGTLLSGGVAVDVFQNSVRIVGTYNGTDKIFNFDFTGNAGTVLTSGNVSTYALPLAGGTVTGNLTVNGTLYSGNSTIRAAIYSDNNNNGITIEAADTANANKKNLYLAAYGGKVGIGTTSPSSTAALTVNGGILARGGAPGAGGANNNGYAFSGNSGDNDSGMFSSADGSIDFYSNSVRVVGVNSNGIDVPQGDGKGVNLNAAGSGYIFGTSGDGADSATANVKIASWLGIGFASSITGQPVPQWQNAAWINVRNGDFATRANITAYSSDERLKKNFEIIDNALEKISKISGYTFDWDTELCLSLGFSPTLEHEHGVKAQEIQQIVPDAVTLAPFDTIDTTDVGKVSKSGKDYLTVRYERLVPLLIQAIKEQNENIKSLEARLARLENKGD